MRTMWLVDEEPEDDEELEEATPAETFGFHPILRRAATALVADARNLREGDRLGARRIAESANILGGLVVAHADRSAEATAVPAYVAAGRTAVLESLQHAIAALAAMATGLTCVPWEGAQAEAVDAAVRFARRLDDHLAAREEMAMPVRDRVLVAAS